MKLKALILKLEKARDAYIKKHGIEPVISCFDQDEGLYLCSNIVGCRGVYTHKKPYLKFPTIKPPR